MKLLFTNEFSIENESLKKNYIMKLENTILKYNNSLLEGKVLVDDATYTNCIELLEMLSQNSPLLENDKEVKFVKSLNEEIIDFIDERLEDSEVLKCYLNPQGLNVRLIYEDGVLVDAKTFGRSFKNQDMFEVIERILTDSNSYLEEFSHIEIDGVLTIPYENLSMLQEIWSTNDVYEGLFALLSNINNEEYGNLEDIIHFVATDIKFLDYPDDQENMLRTIDGKYGFLEDVEFLLPDRIEIERTGNLAYDLEEAINQAEVYDKIYKTDGLRVLLPTEDIIILKLGSWGIRTFTGSIGEIKWVDDKCQKLPVVCLDYPIYVSEDLIVSEVVLNNVNLLLILSIEIGDELRFAYFGEMGILPITKNDEIILN